MEYRFFKCFNQFICVSGHTNINRSWFSVVEMSICDIDERLKVHEKLFVGTLRKFTEGFQSLNLSGQIDMRNSLAASFCNVFAKGHQPLVD